MVAVVTVIKVVRGRRKYNISSLDRFGGVELDGEGEKNVTVIVFLLKFDLVTLRIRFLYYFKVQSNSSSRVSAS